MKRAKKIAARDEIFTYASGIYLVMTGFGMEKIWQSNSRICYDACRKS
jgi:hypothetical protein